MCSKNECDRSHCLLRVEKERLLIENRRWRTVFQNCDGDGGGGALHGVPERAKKERLWNLCESESDASCAARSVH